MQYITAFCRGFWDYVKARDLAAEDSRGWRHGRAIALFLDGGY